MRKFLVILTLFLVIGGIWWEASRQSPTISNKMLVVASFYPMAYFTSQITGDLANVINVTPAGAEPHDYDLSTGNVAAIEKAKLIVLNGEVEAWGQKVKQNLNSSSVPVVTAGEGLFTRQLMNGNTLAVDPHIWLSPVLAKQEVQKILKALVLVDPTNQLIYEQNAQVLQGRLAQLDAAYRVGLKSCQSRDIITSHIAFGYLADAYNLQQIAIAGLSPDEEPSPQQLATVAQFVHNHGVKYIFFESLISPKLAQTIATETGAQTLELNPLEGLSQDDIMGGKDYFSVMQINLDNLQTSLGCQK